MKLLRDAGMLTCMLLISVTVNAASPSEVQVDYSADSTMETEGGMTMKSRIYHTYGQQRPDGNGWIKWDDHDHSEGQEGDLAVDGRHVHGTAYAQFTCK